MSLAFAFHRLRTLFWTFFYRAVGFAIFSSMGKGCVFEGWIDIPQRMGQINLGNRVRICRYVELSVPKGGTLMLGNDTLLSRGVLVSAHKRVEIGAATMLAENVVVHDNNHNFHDRSMPIQHQGMSAAEVIIGADCWLCANASILKGARLGHGCVVAAGAVVNKPFENWSVIAGVPARVISLR